MQEAYADRVQVVGVAGRDEVEAMQAFVDDLGVDGFPHLTDLELEIWTRYGVGSQPAFVFISDDGSVETVLGALGEDRLASMVEDLTTT